jgi:hypothetical protein
MRAAANRPVAGIVWMIVTGMLFVGVTAVVKHVGDALPAPQSAFMRYALGLVFLCRHDPPDPGRAPHAPPARPLRRAGVVHTFGVMLWFYAMTQITIAEVTAMNYLNPVYVTLGAALFLGERLAVRRHPRGGGGARGRAHHPAPGFREISPGHVAMLGTALFFGASYLLAKLLSGETSAAVIVGMLSITVTHRPRALRRRGLGDADARAMGLDVRGGLPRDGGALHDDARLRGGARHGHAARDLPPAPVVGAAGRALLRRAGGRLGGPRRASVILASVTFITWREAVLKRRR